MVLEARVKVSRGYRITIPAPLRKGLGLREGDILILRLEEGRIVAEPARGDITRIRVRLRAGRHFNVEAAVREAVGAITCESCS